MVALKNTLYRSLVALVCLISAIPNHIEADDSPRSSTQSSQPLSSDNDGYDQAPQPDEQDSSFFNTAELKTINDIIIQGNKRILATTIMPKLPYKIGEKFDPRKTGQLIRTLYFDLKQFRNITVLTEDIGIDKINLYVVVEEKRPLKEVIYKGNKNLPEKEIQKKIPEFTNLPSIEEAELKKLSQKLKLLYKSKNFHDAEINATLSYDDEQRATVTFDITEGKKSVVKRINFIGNSGISGKELRKIMFTREIWPISFLDGSGNWQPDMLERDRHVIEQYYQSNGYFMAKVTDVAVERDEQSKQFTITFAIDEGDLYTIKDVKVSGHDILKDEYLLALLPLKSGELYSREDISESIKRLETVWGELGYIYAHIDPSVQPDDEAKTVSVSFFTELGDKVRLNKINIIGNKKTRHDVIRRKLVLRDGDLITNQKMDISKTNVESLGYFTQPDGVNWQKERVSQDLADLNLIVKEAKTGRANIQFGLGGAKMLTSPNTGLTTTFNVADINWFGTGISSSLSGSWAKNEQTIDFNITDPWLFDRPMMGALDVYHRRPTYDRLHNIMAGEHRVVTEKLTGVGGTVGFVSPRLYNSQLLFNLGIESVHYEHRPKASIGFRGAEGVVLNQVYQLILDPLFEPGEFVWTGIKVGMDRRNHPMFPTRGYVWQAISKFGIPSISSTIGFHKFTFDINWFTPLIGEQDLILRLHAFLGAAQRVGHHTIPYRELFHIGGPGTVRGFEFGQIGPQFLGDSIGGKNAAVFNVELQFPITPDFSMKGVAFYDGGSGWAHPFICDINTENLHQNQFNYRHAVGFGIRMLNPAPITIDWGFKLDRRKRSNESAHEIHFSMTYDW